MLYPTISEYVSAIQDSKNNLDKLNYLVPVIDNNGKCCYCNGASSVVFKMKDERTGKFHALKCFTEEQKGRDKAYRFIAEEVNRMIAEDFEYEDSQYVTPVEYLESELLVASKGEIAKYPVLLMDWIDGETMNVYIANNYQNKYAMSLLCYNFCKLATWLRSPTFAHGDINLDNIIVRSDGTLVLVDYDGMFVIDMETTKSPSIGTRDFSHPLRSIDDFDDGIDDFALISIALSLKAISLDPSLLDKYGAPNRLLFSADDYLDLSKCKVLMDLNGLLYDEELKLLLSVFLMASATKDLTLFPLKLFSVKEP